MADSRLQALKQLKLKTVIKESHCSPVQDLSMNMCDAHCRNLFATVAKDQATIYDDMHMGDHVAVVGNLSISNTPEAGKDSFHSCCWINSAGLSRHPYGDAYLAIGGTEPFIHIISIAEAAVVGQLPLPADAAVAELSSAADCPGLLLVLCRDGMLQLWQISSGVCLWSCKTDAFSAAIHPGGTCVLTANRSGKISIWDLSSVDISAARDAHKAGAGQPASCGSAADGNTSGSSVSREPWLAGQQPGSAVDCIRFLTGELVAMKSCDGHMSVHAWPSGTCVSSWKVPGCGGSSSSSGYSKRCCFGATRDGRFVCVGNHTAAAYVYDTCTGCQVTRVEAIRVQGHVRACGLSEDCRHLLMVVGHGYVFRFEHRPTGVDQGPEDAEASGSDTEMPDAVGAQQQQRQQQQQQQGQQQSAAAAGAGTSEASGSPPQQQQQQAALVDQQQAPSAAATPSCPEHTPNPELPSQQQQQQQYTPGLLLSFGGLQTGLGDATMSGPPSPRSLTGLLGINSTPPAEDSVGGGDLMRDGSLPGLSGGVGGEQQKRQRLMGQGVDDSPLVFRPTPRKQ